ncbi:hypothetical protein ABZX66_20870 [Micromonospora aurantiaca]|uniref:hypothetical protein n=1 Tax=Micromonospora aurantiaca (nom. illeg.) TaxID=47850 RepID=UPI00339E8C4E
MTSSLLDARRGSQTPRVSKFPPYPLSAAPEVIDLAESAGLHLDEWQKYVLTHGLGSQVDGRWTANRVSVWVPRQNGKGAIIEALELAWLFLFDEELIIHSAHQHRTSQKAYERLERYIRRTPDLLRRVKQFRQANGEQQIELHNGHLLQYVTRSRTAIRGFSAKKLVLDEAQELTSEQVAAIMPTLSAQYNWQAWFFGTPPDDPAAWCYGLKEDGEVGVPRLAHFDWGAALDLDDPADVARAGDPELWYACNPALGERIEIETVQDEHRPSGLGAKFPQERLGVWQPKASAGSGVIADALWRDQVARDAARPADVALAVQVNSRRTFTAIAAVGPQPDGTLLASVVDYRPGTHWVAERVAELRERWNPVAIAVQDKGPTAPVLLELEKLGITGPDDPEEPARGDLAVPWAAEVAVAYGLFIDAVHQRRLFHLDEAPLNVALGTAKVRALSGGTAWDFKPEDAAPLLAATFAHWAWVTLADKVNDDYDVADSFLQVGG